MKRIYKIVSTKNTPKGYEILLDDRPLKTPGKKSFLLPCEALAQEVMREWAGQGKKIIPDTMPITQIICTKIDRVCSERAAMTKEILKYLDTDLLCYRTLEPAQLAEKQRESWDPWLSWFHKEFDVSLLTTTDLKALRQPEKAHHEVRAFVNSLDEDRFTILQLITPLAGSVILALAFIRQAIAAEALFQAIRVEETYQAILYKADQYGPDPMQEKKDISTRRDLVAAETILGHLGKI